MSQLESDMMIKIKESNIHDAEYENLLNKLLKDRVNLNGTKFKVYQEGLTWCKRRIYMPNVADLKLFILNEMHKPPYAGHPGYQKMVIAVRKQFYWPNFEGRSS